MATGQEEITMKINFRKLGRETAKAVASIGVETAVITGMSHTLMPLAKTKGGEIAVAVVF